MRTALASDFDNTLYFHNTEERFYAQDIFEILFFQKRGGLFGICTGRSPDSILDMTGNFLHPDFIISVSGALIVDGEGNVLDSCCLSPAVTEEVCRAFEDRAAMVVHAGGHVYTLKEAEYPLQRKIRSYEELPQDAVYGISMRFENERAAADAVSLMKERYGGQIAPYQNINHVDIVAAGCSKGTGAARVRELFGIDKLGAIGDSYNDLPLIESADMGFTFAHAPQELRDAADEIVTSVSQAIGMLV